MADELRIGDRPSLERPVLITAFRGWNDGGQGASLAGAYLARLWEAEQFAELDPEEFFDFQSNRPMVTLTEGLERKLEWPENLFFHGEIPGAGRGAVLLLGDGDQHLPAGGLADAPLQLVHAMGDLLQADLLDFEVEAIDESAPEGWRIFFRTTASRDLALEHVRRAFPAAAAIPLAIADEDWAARSQAGLKAVTVGKLIVAPPSLTIGW